jgi:hypothetical protein
MQASPRFRDCCVNKAGVRFSFSLADCFRNNQWCVHKRGVNFLRAHLDPRIGSQLDRAGDSSADELDCQLHDGPHQLLAPPFSKSVSSMLKISLVRLLGG